MDNNSVRELYEVFRVEKKVGLFLEDHIKRLLAGAAKSGIRLDFDFRMMENYLKSFLIKQNIETGNVRLSVFFDPHTGEIQSHNAEVIPHSYPSQEQYKKGISCGLLFSERDNPGTKIANTTLRKNANQMIEEKSVFEVLLVNHQGEITEGSRSNVFFIMEDQLYTAPEQLVLPGIARKKTLQTAQELNIPVLFEALAHENIKDIEAAFITGTSPRILPIKNIEGYNLKPEHLMIQKLMAGFSKLINSYINHHLR
ncbi:aminotransferase class IV [Marinilabilia salmonicolor]|uniref:aminotransferase class IV n=1 Tax=Marinilabilia salmonicolor TaxID=989 RepID=UPI000299FAA9|nr:aminotransferase class IV [Marinilabilia salmonicolor]